MRRCSHVVIVDSNDAFLRHNALPLLLPKLNGCVPTAGGVVGTTAMFGFLNIRERGKTEAKTAQLFSWTYASCSTQI